MGVAMLTKRDLQAIRHRLGVTQVQFARLLDVKPATVARWERGHHVPSTYTMGALMRLARRLGENPPTIPKTSKATQTSVLDEQEHLMTTHAAAAWLGITPYTLNAWCRLGRLPSVQYSPRGKRLFRLADLKGYRAAHRREGSATIPSARHRAGKPFTPTAEIWAAKL